jgi:hypothetical protein
MFCLYVDILHGVGPVLQVGQANGHGIGLLLMQRKGPWPWHLMRLPQWFCSRSKRGLHHATEVFGFLTTLAFCMANFRTDPVGESYCLDHLWLTCMFAGCFCTSST